MKIVDRLALLLLFQFLFSITTKGQEKSAKDPGFSGEREKISTGFLSIIDHLQAEGVIV
jgi:hypothetical protein